MSDLRSGEILAIQGSWGSGLGTLLIQEGDSSVQEVFFDNGPTIRAFDAAWGVIVEGHRFDTSKIVGKHITYSMNWLGMLEGFTPMEETAS